MRGRWWAVAMTALLVAGCGGGHTSRPPAIGPANDVLFRAIGLVGTPYRYGGDTPDGGFDCSGLVGYVFREAAGVALPRTADAMEALDRPRVDRTGLMPGDLVFFRGSHRSIGHVGIYVGEGRFVHAPNAGGTVRLDQLDGDYWRDHYAGAKRIL